MINNNTNPTFDDKVADMLQELRAERDKYKAALEKIAGSRESHCTCLSDLRASIKKATEEVCDESTWPKGKARTQRWEIYQSGVIRTLDRVLQAIDRGAKDCQHNATGHASAQTTYDSDPSTSSPSHEPTC